MLDYPRTTPSCWRSCAVLTALCGTLALAGSAAGARENTFTITGKYHGTLTLTDPAVDCFIEEFSNSHLSDAIKLDPLTGTITGLKGRTWFFLATEPHQGTFVTKAANEATSAKLRPTNANDTIAFAQTSGTIHFDGKTGSASLKMVFNNGFENTVTETVTGSWSCPSVHHL